MKYKGCNVNFQGTTGYAYRYANRVLKEKPNTVYMDVPTTTDEWKENLRDNFRHLRESKDQVHRSNQ